MAKVRKLTIAALHGNFFLSFRDIANSDIKFESISGGTITVDRSSSGRTYVIRTNTDHIRVFVTLQGPDDLPNLFYKHRSDDYGWWELEGYARQDFPGGGNLDWNANQFEAWAWGGNLFGVEVPEDAPKSEDPLSL